MSHVGQAVILIGGPKRSGKTTLAKNLAKLMEYAGLRPVVIDVDEVRQNIFGEKNSTARIGSPENIEMHACATRAMFGIVGPAVLRAGGSPIIVATHSRRENYYAGKQLAEDYNTKFRFLLLESPPLEGLVLRAKKDKSASDTNDLTNPEQLKAFQESLERLKTSYEPNYQEPILKT